MNRVIKEHYAAGVIFGVFILLAVIYSLVTPPFEAGDESRHYAVVKYMADTGRLPVQQPGEAQIHWSHEGNQPPLYYALAAALTFWIDTGDWQDVYWYNPHTTIGNPLRPDNKNITIHPPNADWPWRGAVLAVHLIRFFSIALAGVTILTGYATALSLFAGRRWLAAGAMAITAFNPMFLFISASVNNDNLVITLVSLALLLLVRVSESAKGEERRAWSEERISQFKIQSLRPPMGNSKFIIPVALGLLIGLGALSKLYALGLVPLAGLLLAVLAYRDRRPKTADRGDAARSTQQRAASLWDATRNTQHATRSLPLGRFTFHVLTCNLLMLATIVLVAGWFYARNALLYHGDILAIQVMRDTAGQRAEAPSLATLWAEFEGFRIAYWALFGGVNILVSPWIYRVLDALSLLAALGVAAFLAKTSYSLLSRDRRAPTVETQHAPRTTQQRAASLGDTSRPAPVFWVFTLHASPPVSLPTFFVLLAWYLIMVAGFIGWNLTQPAGQGRLLYPAITAISALGLLGLTWWLPVKGQRAVAGPCVLALAALAGLVPVLYLAPAYAKPPRLARADLPADLQPVDFTYDGTLRLVGYQLGATTVRPAETLPLTLYWEVVRPASLDYSIFIHLLGRQRQVAGQLDTYPGGGAWPTTLLTPGDILADYYEVPIRPETETTQAPTRLDIAAGIYDFNEPGRPGRPVVNAAGQTVEPIIASARLVPWQWPAPPRIETPVEFFVQPGGSSITLLSYQLAGDGTAVTLNWQANRPVTVDYTVFLQAWRVDPVTGTAASAAQGKYAAGFDGPPRQGDYPTTLWQPGDIIVDTHPLDLAGLPPGDYTLLAGLYDPATGQRLAASAGGNSLPDYAVNVGRLRR